MNRKAKFVLAFEAMYTTFKHPFGQKNHDVYKAIIDNYFAMSNKIAEDDFMTFMTRSFTDDFPKPDTYQRAVSSWVGKREQWSPMTDDDKKWGFLNSQVAKCWQLLGYPRGRKILSMYHIGGCNRLKLQPQKFFTDHIKSYVPGMDFDWDRVKVLLEKEMRKHVNPTAGNWYSIGQITAGR